MKELVSDFIWGMPFGLYTMLIIAAGLLIAGFFCPPIAIIDKSVLLGAGELMAGGWLFYISTHVGTIVSNGARIRAQKGDASIEISKSEEKRIREEREAKGE